MFYKRVNILFNWCWLKLNSCVRRCCCTVSLLIVTRTNWDNECSHGDGFFSTPASVSVGSVRIVLNLTDLQVKALNRRC